MAFRFTGPGEQRLGAFSLIEVFLVVLVVFILLALAIPRISSMRDSADRASCIANLRAIELAITKWEDEKGREFPQGWIDKAGLGGGKKSCDLSLYVESKSVFDCSANGRNGSEYFYVLPVNDQVNKYADYFPGVNCYGAGRPPHLRLEHPHTTYSEDPYKKAGGVPPSL